MTNINTFSLLKNLFSFLSVWMMYLRQLVHAMSKDYLELELEWLWAAMYILGTKARLCARATKALQSWVISPVPLLPLSSLTFLMFYSFLLFTTLQGYCFLSQVKFQVDLSFFFCHYDICAKSLVHMSLCAAHGIPGLCP